MGGKRNGVCIKCAEARQFWSHPLPYPSWTSLGLQPQSPKWSAVQPGTQPLLPWSGSLWVELSTAGGKGWAAHPLYLIMYSFIVSYAN